MALENLMRLQVILSATDRMSRIFESAFGKANKAMGGLSDRAKKVTDMGNAVAATTGAMGLAIMTPLALAANEAINFEDKMASVSKVLNLQNGSKQLNEIGNQVKGLGDYLAKSPTQVAELYANLAQGGAPRKELTKIAKLAGEVGVAFDIDPGIAGDRFIKLSNAMGLTVDQTKKATDAINHLSDKTAAKASQILDFFAAGAAGAARALNLSAQEAAALGSVYISRGKSGEESATTVERMAKTLRNSDKQAGKIFKAAGGGLAGLLLAIRKGDQMTGDKRFQFFKEFGEYGVEVEQLANNYNKLSQTLGYVSNSGKYANSVQKEFANRSNTTAFKLAQAQANAQAFAIEIGTSLLPAITGILKRVTPVIRSMTAWANKNPVVVGTITKMAAVLGSLLLIISAVSKVVAIFNMVLYANPIVWVIAGIIALAAAVYLIYKNWGKITEFFGKIWTGIKFAMGEAWNALKTVARNFYNAGANIVKMIGKGIWDFITFPVRAIKAVATKIRAYLPFSPAKEGPLKTLHKVRIAETIAQSIRPGKLSNAMSSLVSPVQSQAFSFSSAGGGGGGISINFAPVVNVGAGGDTGSVMKGLRQYESQLLAMIREAMRKEDRTKF